MANISSSDDSSTPPREFHLSSCSLSEGRISPVRHKCPLCRKLSDAFYCRQCINSGSFQSTRQQADSFEKQLALLEIRKNIEQLQAILENLQKPSLKINKLSSDERQTKQDIEIIKLALAEKKKRREVNIQKLSELDQLNQKWRERLPHYERKVEEMENYISVRKEKNDKKNQMLKEKQEDVKAVVKWRIKQLFDYIFPITTIRSTIDSYNLGLPIDASQTTIISDHWEYSDYFSEMKYCIAGPTLPSTGDYSAYNTWVAKNQDIVPSSNSTESVELNPAFTISAALTYTAQLVNILAHILNIRLPCKMTYSDFCCCYMNKAQFNRRVTRLNGNILYLCFLQNVTLAKLTSTGTIHNILQLIEDERCDLGRIGPFEYNYHQARRLEKPLLGQLKPGEESDSEDNDCLPSEWEAVPHVQCPEMAPGPAVVQAPPQVLLTQQASTMAGSLVNTAAAGIASLWRGFTGR